MVKKSATRKPIAPQSAEPSSEAPAAEVTAEQATESKPIDLNTPAIQNAVAQGKALIAEGKSKADAARAIFAAIKGESKDVIVAAFVEGATLTPKGALTYWYNCKRRAAKAV